MILLMLLYINNFHVGRLDVFYGEFTGIWSAIFFLVKVSHFFEFFLKFVYLRIILSNLQNDLLFKFLVWLTLQNVFIFVAKYSFEFSFKLFLITFLVNLCDFVVDFSLLFLSFGGLQNLIPFEVQDFGEGLHIIMTQFLDRLNVLVLLHIISDSCLLMWRWWDRLL